MIASDRRVLACAAVLACASVPAFAQGAAPAYPPYPALRSPDAVAQWVRTQTDVPLGTVVGIGQDSIFSVEPGRDRSVAPYVRVSIRQEAIDPDFTRRLGGRSAMMVVDLDCSTRRVFQRALFLYAGSNRKDAARALGAGSDWREAPQGSYMDSVLAAVCDPGYRPLYASATPTAAIAVAARTAARSVPAGDGVARVEIGRFASTMAALEAAQALDQAFPDAMVGKRRRIELSTVRGRTEFRGLVEGFASRADAEAFCRRLQAAGRPCSSAG
jgi:hypothetical protein